MYEVSYLAIDAFLDLTDSHSRDFEDFADFLERQSALVSLCSDEGTIHMTAGVHPLTAAALLTRNSGFFMLCKTGGINDDIVHIYLLVTGYFATN